MLTVPCRMSLIAASEQKNIKGKDVVWGTVGQDLIRQIEISNVWNWFSKELDTTLSYELCIVNRAIYYLLKVPATKNMKVHVIDRGRGYLLFTVANNYVCDIFSLQAML